MQKSLALQLRSLTADNRLRRIIQESENEDFSRFTSYCSDVIKTNITSKGLGIVLLMPKQLNKKPSRITLLFITNYRYDYSVIKKYAKYFGKLYAETGILPIIDPVSYNLIKKEGFVGENKKILRERGVLMYMELL